MQDKSSAEHQQAQNLEPKSCSSEKSSAQPTSISEVNTALAKVEQKHNSQEKMQQAEADERGDNALAAGKGPAQVFDCLLAEQLEASVEIEMVEEAIKEDQEVSSSGQQRDEPPLGQGKERTGQNPGQTQQGEEGVQKEEVAVAEDDSLSTAAAAGALTTAAPAEGTSEAASAKEQRRQEKKKNSYSIPALCQVK
jgi:hypothetical protein